MARYGYFDEQHREYVSTHPELPQPWHNYIRYDDGVFWHTTPNDVGSTVGTATWVSPWATSPPPPCSRTVSVSV